MSRYPDWVNAYKEKGTSIKKVGNSYYLYRTTSRRVPGKKYPQPVQSFIGTITKEGLVCSKVRKISTETVAVYEYGFSYAMKCLLPEKFRKDFQDNGKADAVFLNIIYQFSPTSYLLRDKELQTCEELHVSLGVQIKKFERLLGIELRKLLPLCGVYLVETKECDMISKIAPEMERLFSELGVDIHAL